MKYYAINAEAADMYKAIDLCGNKLLEEGCVVKAFSKSCIAREKKYPTGLPGIIPIAIPHCEANMVKHNSICCLILKHPVKFYRMDEPELGLEVKIIFNIAVFEPDSHLKILKNLMNICNDKVVMNSFLNLEVNKIPALMKKYLE